MLGLSMVFIVVVFLTMKEGTVKHVLLMSKENKI